ncbi:MAG: beta-ketoacyl synthase chain length factor [Victivallales bacterium]|nr:beta-ketoacyl synthase chain length factor [Victivallales bacterium]
MQPILSKTYHGFTDEELKAARAKYGLRRVDRFTSMAIAAIDHALEKMPTQDCALVTATCFGPHKTVFATLDDILDYPEDQILPTKFSHSVQNAAASYLCTVLKIHGPSFAINGFEDMEKQAISLAGTLLDASMAGNVIVVVMEEAGLLTELARAMLPERFNNKIDEMVKVLLF